MKSVMLKLALVLTLALIAVVAFAQVNLPPTVDGQVDYMKILEQLIANPKAFLSTSGIALLVFLTTQAIKRFGFKLFSDRVQFAVIAVLGFIYAFLVKKIGGDVQSSAIIMGLLGSGYAATFYAAIKMNFPKLLDFLGEKK